MCDTDEMIIYDMKAVVNVREKTIRVVPTDAIAKDHLKIFKHLTGGDMETDELLIQFKEPKKAKLSDVFYKLFSRKK